MTPYSGLDLDTARIAKIMRQLSHARPIFHSEADFQHALAWHIHKIVPKCEVRLEYKPFRNELKYVDIWLSLSGLSVALELKYPTRKLNHRDTEEDFSLRYHRARDTRQYTFLKDIERLERVVSRLDHVRGGFAILLTNDPDFWEPESPTVGGADFDLCDGRRVWGKLVWNKEAGKGTTEMNESPVKLAHQYELRWRNYGDVGNGTHREFRYLVVHVQS